MKKIISNTLVIVFVIALSGVMAFSAEPVPSAPAKNYNYEPTASVKDLQKVKAEIKKETDWLSVREAKTRRTLLEAIGNVSGGVKDEVQSAMTDIKKSVKESIDGATGELAGATKDLKGVAEDIKNSTKSTATAIDNVGSSVKSAIDGLGILLGAIFIFVMTVVCGLIICSQRKILGKLNGGMVIPEIADIRDDVSEIKDSVDEIKKVVKPDSFTLHFTVAGQEWLYNVPVNNRGKFVSIYAPKVSDPADMPATPTDTVRATVSEEKDLAKSCKSAMKEFLKPTCDQVQKNLIDHLISTGELRKA